LGFTIKTKEEAYGLEAFVKKIGEDLLIAIWGGEKPHIGAVAVAQPRPSLKDERAVSATASVFCYLGHKDDIIAKEAAEKLSATLNTNVTVTAGVHWDDIDEAGIKAIIANSQELVNLIIEKIAAQERK
jgi:predicted esterase